MTKIQGKFVLLLSIIGVLACHACKPSKKEVQDDQSVAPGAANDFSIRNGVASLVAWESRVFELVMVPNAMGDRGIGTAFAAKYKRCLVTAAHNVASGVDKVLAGASPTLATGPLQEVQLGWQYPGHETPWTDLGVLFLKAKVKNDNSDPKFIAADFYNPMTLTKTIGLPSVYTEPTEEQVQNNPAAKMTAILGYGASTSNDLDPNADSGTLRTGANIKTLYFMQGSSQVVPRVGSYYATLDSAGESPKQVCMGDSGGPAMVLGANNVPGPVFGVVASGSVEKCDQEKIGFVTGFDDTNIPGKQSNWAWIQNAIDKTCRLNLKTQVTPANGGKVTGTISPTQEVYDAADFGQNNVYNCGYDAATLSTGTDCDENVHDPQTAIVTASPAPTYYFVQWDGTYCPCQGSTSTTCSAAYGQIGHYSETESIDESLCVAVFASGSPSPSPSPSWSPSPSVTISPSPSPSLSVSPSPTPSPIPSPTPSP